MSNFMLEEVFNTVSIVMSFPHVTIPLQVNFIYPSVNTDSKSIYLSVVHLKLSFHSSWLKAV